MKGPVFPLPEFVPLQNTILDCSYEGHELKPGYAFKVEAQINLDSVEIQLHLRKDDPGEEHDLTIIFAELIAPGAFANLVIPVPWLFRQDYDPRAALCRYVETYLSKGRIEISDLSEEMDGEKAMQLTLAHALYRGRISIPAADLENYFEPKPKDPPPPPPPDVQ